VTSQHRARTAVDGHGAALQRVKRKQGAIEEIAKLVRSEIGKWAKVVKDSGAKVD